MKENIEMRKARINFAESEMEMGWLCARMWIANKKRMFYGFMCKKPDEFYAHGFSYT